MRVTVMPIVVVALWIDPKGFERRLVELDVKGRIKIIHPTYLFRPARILRKVLEARGELLYFWLEWKITSWNLCEIQPSENKIYNKKYSRNSTVYDFSFLIHKFWKWIRQYREKLNNKKRQREEFNIEWLDRILSKSWWWFIRTETL